MPPPATSPQTAAGFAFPAQVWRVDFDPLSVEVVNPLEETRWDEQISAFAACTIFHSQGWARVLRETYGFTPFYLIVREGQRLRGALPLMEAVSAWKGRRGVSLPFSDHVTMLAEDSAVSSRLLDRAFALGRERNWKSIEFKGASITDGPLSPRRGEGVESDAAEERESGHKGNEPSWPKTFAAASDSNPLSPPRGEGANLLSLASHEHRSGNLLCNDQPGTGKSPEPAGRKTCPTPSISYYHHALDLRSSASELMAGMDASVRRAVRKAEKSGVRIECSRSPEAMRRYYRLHCLTRRRQGLPPQPWRFFLNLQKHLLAREAGHVTLASRSGKYIAGAVFLHFGRLALYKFGGSDRAHQSYRANDLIMASAIQHYAREGFAALDFGRTSRDNEGLRRFKRQFGAEETVIRYYKYDLARERYGIEKDLTSGWHSLIFRWMPLWASRMVGNLLYKHFA